MLHFNKDQIENIPEFTVMLSYLGFKEFKSSDYYIMQHNIVGFTINNNSITIIVDRVHSFTIIIKNEYRLENIFKKIEN